ncbi:hypothetical protein ABEB36_003937 [Hypothenemus hampei]|uniref:N-acetyllactosaminide beta-1,3-N-acetylglucosaminyltransferase n=1 Tax=Hypothenemus hampei TaxID=57062 RepID=A0ABD1F2Y9_HYPHA
MNAINTKAVLWCKYWEGPISVAAYIPDGDPKVILESVLHLCYCEPQMSRVSLHLVFRKDLALSFYLSKLMPPVRCDLQEISIQQSANMNIQPSNDSNITNNWYPINVCRNAARQAALTEYVLVCDVELMPSQGLASRFIDMTESYKCLEPETCQKRVFVVPVFEVENTEELPRNKQQLVQLMEQSKAVYFHQLSCVHCQKFPGLEQWKESDSGDLIKPLIETKREVPYHRWEPIYIGTKQEPMYFEQLSWEGFQDKMLQMHEMCLAGYNLVVLDGAFLVHWPGIKKAKRKDEPWRLPYVKMNQRYYDTLLRNITKRYHPNPQCSLKKP